MTDLELRHRCQQIALAFRAALTAEIRADLIAQAEAVVMSQPWFTRGVAKARKRKQAKPKQSTRRYKRKDGLATVPQLIVGALDRREFTAVGIANDTGIPLPIVRTTLTRLTRDGRVTHNDARPALYSLPTQAEQAAE